MPVDFLADRVAATPDRTALVDVATERSWTFRELDSIVDAQARHLRELATSTGAADSGPSGSLRLGTVLSPRPEFVVTLHAAMRLGWTLVGLDTSLTAWELRRQLDRAQPAILLCEAATEPTAAEAVADALPTESHVIPARTIDEGGDVQPLAPSAEIMDSTAESPHDPATLAADETVLLLFTSGTTGDPKGVKLTRRNLAASATASAFRLGVSPGDRWLGCLPVSHMGGIAPVVRTAYYGTTLVLQRSFEAAETAQILRDREITGISLVPTQLDRLLEYDASEWSLDTVLLGGAPAPAMLVERARAADVPVYPTYGLTETASQVATARPATVAEHPGTVGQPLLGASVTVLADGDPADPGEAGEIVVDGPMVTPGYLDEELTADCFGSRGLHTGDVGYRDGDGRLRIEGRQDDLILTGGELVAPSEVAEAIRSHTGVADAAVVGLDDPDWGERVAALVVAGDANLSAEHVREHCRELLASYKAPKTVALASQIPRTASGTIDRAAVREALDGD